MRLVEPAEQWRATFLDMASECSAAGDHRYDLALHDFGACLRSIAEGRHTEDLLPGRVPGTEFWLEEAGRIVACVRLRFWLTPELEREGGHVGYDVRPSMRRRGYGTAVLRLALPLVRQHGIQRVRITCEADNSGSRKIIERSVSVHCYPALALCSVHIPTPSAGQPSDGSSSSYYYIPPHGPGAGGNGTPSNSGLRRRTRLGDPRANGGGASNWCDSGL
jgi:predicted acetyltransferase